eukprot:8023802-Heterocapsa_arctica.AAC.1
MGGAARLRLARTELLRVVVGAAHVWPRCGRDCGLRLNCPACTHVSGSRRRLGPFPAKSRFLGVRALIGPGAGFID